jgi:hypothetical protein
MKYPGARGALCIFLLLTLFFPVGGQTAPVWVSHYSSSTSSHDSPDSILMATDGSIYVSGFSFSYEENRSKAVIVKYSNAGQQLWAVQNTNISPVNFNGQLPLTALDSQGHVRIAGISTRDLTAMGLIFQSSDGVFSWERRFSLGYETHPRAMAVDTFGNVVVVGHGGYDVSPFVVKYSNAGTLLWSRSYARLWSDYDDDGSGSDFFYAGPVAMLSNGDILAAFGVRSRGVMILKHSENGNLLWTAETGRFRMPSQLKVDPSGNIFVAILRGSFESEIIKLNAKGEFLWRLPVESFAVQHMTLDSAGDLFLTGEPNFGHVLSVMKVNRDGTEVWRARAAEHGSYLSQSVGIAVHGSGVSIGFPSFDMQSSQGPLSRFAAAHYDAAGVEVWRETYTNATGGAAAMIGDANQGIYLTGFRDPYEAADFQSLKFDVVLNPARPTILSPPQSLEVVAGTNRAGFSVSAGNGPHTFQWRWHGGPIPGATNSTLVLTNLNIDDAGGYSVVVSNAHAYVVSPEAWLTVRGPPNVYWDEFTPTNQTLVAGNELRLRAYTYGDGPVQFEWRRDGAPLPQTNSVLVLETLTGADAGTYTVSVRSPYGSATNSVSITVIPRSALDHWRWVSPRPQGNDLNAVAFGNGRFVAVGDLGTLLTSTDGMTWAVTNLHNGPLAGIAFGNGTFVAISYAGAIYTSSDAAAWTMRADLSGEQERYLQGISFVNDRFVAVGERVYSSTDGVAWSDHGAPPVAGSSVAYGTGKYVMAADGYMLLSTNLTTWTMHNVDSSFSRFSGVAYGNGTFIFNEFWAAQSSIYTSPDGVVITQRRSILGLENVAFVNGRFFSLGYGIETSPDGLSWTRVDGNDTSFLDTPFLRSIAYGNNLYVAVGHNGVIATSVSGQTWTRRQRGLNQFRGMAHGNRRYVIIANNGLWTSPDGSVWSTVPGLAIQQPNAILWSHGSFVVVGNNGELLTSRDGLAWTRVAVTTNHLTAVIHDGNRFVVLGQGTTLFSTNAASWVARPGLGVGIIPGYDLPGLVFGGGTYLAYDYFYLFRSTNAINWSFEFRNPRMTSVAYGNGIFVGLDGYYVYTSPDGLRWNENPGQSAFRFGKLTFANGMFIASAGDGAFATSTNGQNWVVHRSHARFWGSTVSSIAYADGALWMVGYNEAIVRSAQLQPVIRTRKTGSSLELIVQTWPGQTFRLQHASVLGTWTDLKTYTPETESTIFIDNLPGFYRIAPP